MKAVRQALVDHEVTRAVNATDPATGAVFRVRKVVRRGLARKSVNKLVGRVRRVFAWAVEEELVPPAVHAALLRVKGLRRGKTAARDTPRVRPAPDPDVEAVLPLLRPAVRAVVEDHQLAGCRPQDVVQMRGVPRERGGGRSGRDRPGRRKVVLPATPYRIAGSFGRRGDLQSAQRLWYDDRRNRLWNYPNQGHAGDPMAA